jgi:hypothetical protein
MKRKLLFVLFTEDACRQRHALMWAIDLYQKGHEAKILIEGGATQRFMGLVETNAGHKELFLEAKGLGLIVGACQAAAQGCATPENNVVELIKAHGINLCSELRQHAGIEPFVQDGYEIVVF